VKRRDRNHCVTPPIVGVSCHACALSQRDRSGFGAISLYVYRDARSVTGVTRRDISRLSQQGVTWRFCHASKPSTEAALRRPLLPQHSDAKRRLNSGDSRIKRLTLKSGLRVLTPSRPGHSTGAETVGRGAVIKGVTPTTYLIAIPMLITDRTTFPFLTVAGEDN
jgi:hypothetical protein